MSELRNSNTILGYEKDHRIKMENNLKSLQEKVNFGIMRELSKI